MHARCGAIVILLAACDVHSTRETHLIYRAPVRTTSSSTATAKSQQPNLIDDGGRIHLPVVVKRVQPNYPSNVQTDVTLVVVEAVVSSKGDVTDAKVKGGNSAYSNAVLEAIKQWKFRPGTVDGRAVDMPYQVSVNIDVR